MEKRASIQLSVNAIVVLVLAITILALGLGFIKTQFGTMEQQFEVVSDEVKSMMAARLKQSGKLLAFEVTDLVLPRGREEKKYLAVKNTASSNRCFYFQFVCEGVQGGVCPSGSGINASWDWFSTFGTVLVEAGESDTIPLTIIPSGDASRYSVEVRVWRSSQVGGVCYDITDLGGWGAVTSSELSADASTVLLMHLNEHVSAGEGANTFVKDYSSQGNDGTKMGGGLEPVWTDDGRFGKALSFDGINDYVNAGDIADRASGTISFWFKPSVTFNSSSAITQGLWGKYESGNYDATISLKGQDFSGGDGSAGAIQTKIENSGAAYVATTTDSWLAGQWYHFAFTWGGGTSATYVNGVQEKTVASSRTLASTGNDEIGRSRYDTFNIASGGPLYFNGTIDEVQILSKQLTDEEVKKDYYEGTNSRPYASKSFYVETT